jgi:hypothetical protein
MAFLDTAIIENLPELAEIRKSGRKNIRHIFRHRRLRQLIGRDGRRK